MSTLSTTDEILSELRGYANESIKRILVNHGAKEPILGVKIEDLKKIQKRLKTDYQLALDLYATGISDAMYLAGLIADDGRMTRQDLQRWARQASWGMISEYTVASVAAGSRFGWELGLKWIDSKSVGIATSGWSTLSGIVTTKQDAELDLPELKRLLVRVQKTIHHQPDHVRYVMNGFVIAVGSAVTALTEIALKTADKIGKVEVDRGNTACKVPDARLYIEKVRQRGALGKKRKSSKC